MEYPIRKMHDLAIKDFLSRLILYNFGKVSLSTIMASQIMPKFYSSIITYIELYKLRKSQPLISYEFPETYTMTTLLYISHPIHSHTSPLWPSSIDDLSRSHISTTIFLTMLNLLKFQTPNPPNCNGSQIWAQLTKWNLGFSLIPLHKKSLFSFSIQLATSTGMETIQRKKVAKLERVVLIKVIFPLFIGNLL